MNSPLKGVGVGLLVLSSFIAMSYACFLIFGPTAKFIVVAFFTGAVMTLGFAIWGLNRLAKLPADNPYLHEMNENPVWLQDWRRMDPGAFMEKYGLHCSCRPGYVVCRNCSDIYSRNPRRVAEALQYGEKTDGTHDVSTVAGEQAQELVGVAPESKNL